MFRGLCVAWRFDQAALGMMRICSQRSQLPQGPA